MTNSVARHETGTAVPAGFPIALANLVGEVADFFDEVWGMRHQVYQCPGAANFLSCEEIWNMFDCGLLVAPYFGVLERGHRSRLAEVIETRNVLNRRMPAYADAAAVRERYRSGHAVVLNQPEHWHAALHELVDGLRTELRADVRSSLLLSPADTALQRTSTRGAHLLVLQLDGRTAWSVDESPGTDPGGSRLVEITLFPGDVLYVPGSRSYRELTSGMESLRVEVVAEQPTACDLAKVVLTGFLDAPRAKKVAGNHHFMSLPEKVAWLRTELSAYLSSVDTAALVVEAVRVRQQADQT